jgi:hypothetical protein
MLPDPGEGNVPYQTLPSEGYVPSGAVTDSAEGYVPSYAADIVDPYFLAEDLKARILLVHPEVVGRIEAIKCDNFGTDDPRFYCYNDLNVDIGGQWFIFWVTGDPSDNSVISVTDYQ